MRGILLSQEIINNVWAIHPKLAIGYFNTAVKIITEQRDPYSDLKQIKEENEKSNALAIASPEAGGYNIYHSSQVSGAPEGSMAIISYTGVVRMKSGLSQKGTEETRKELAAAGNSSNIAGVLLRLHTGGGSVFGTQSLSNDVKEFESKYKKPIAVLIEDQACSAGYWIASGAPMIFGANETVEVGCIGTMTTFYDFKDLYEKEGIKEHLIRATKSFNKNEEYYQALMGNPEPLQKNILDPLNEQFLRSVKNNRRGKIDLENKVSQDGSQVAEVLSGRTYYGKQAIEVGLIDKIANQEQALKYLERESKKYTKTKKSSAMNTVKNYTKLSDEELNAEISNLEASKPAETDDSYDAHIALIDMANAEKSRRELEVKVKTVEAENKKLKESNSDEDVKTLNEKVVTLEGQNETKDKEIEGLKADKKKTEEDLAEANTKKEEAEKAQTAAEQAQKTAEEERDASNKKTAAYEEFINAEYGESALTAFVANENGDISQPEGLKTKKVYLSKEERIAKADQEAEELAMKAMAKKEE